MPDTRSTPLPKRPLLSSTLRRRIRLVLDVLMIAVALLMIIGFCYLWYAAATADWSNLG